MPKQLINIIGIVVCVGILSLAIAVVALPMYLQSVTTGAQTDQVAQTNEIYAVQVEGLRAEEERMPDIEASVTELRTQIPSSNELDDVFELVASAAASSNVAVQNITAGENLPFQLRTGPLALGEEADAPTPVTPTTDDVAETTAENTSEESDSPSPTPTGPAAEGGVAAQDPRQQVDFTIAVKATAVADAIAFLDGLRGGPRLLSSIQSIIRPTGTGYDVSVSALTYVALEE